MTNFKSVKKFMETFGQEVRQKASFPNEKITSLRYDLIKEELEELKEAMDKKGKKTGAENAMGTGALKIKLKPTVNTGMTGSGTGGLN